MNNTDIISLIALMIAVQSLLMFFFHLIIKRLLKKHKKSMNQVLDNKNLLKNSHQNILNSLSELSAVQKFYGGLLVRLYDYFDKNQKKIISEEIAEYNWYLDKKIYELALFSENEVDRVSAILALSEFGDLYSLEMMKNCLNDIENRKGDLDLKSGVERLSKNIDWLSKHQKRSNW